MEECIHSKAAGCPVQTFLPNDQVAILFFIKVFCELQFKPVAYRVGMALLRKTPHPHFLLL